ncbi:MAG: hypothetical protein ABR887_03975 [Methanoregulaceae archaeon]|jgi:hypothetical protein
MRKIFPIFAIIVLIFLVLTSGCANNPPITNHPSTTQTVLPATTITTATPTEVQTSIEPTPSTPSLKLGQAFSYNNQNINFTMVLYDVKIYPNYSWRSVDGKFYDTEPSPGNKFLFIFLNLENLGQKRMWIPTETSLTLTSNGVQYYPLLTHTKGLTIDMVQYHPDYQKLVYTTDWNWVKTPPKRDESGSSYVYGYNMSYVYPGSSNAVDGYLIYEVPQSINLDRTYLSANVNGFASPVWSLH